MSIPALVLYNGQVHNKEKIIIFKGEEKTKGYGQREEGCIRWPKWSLRYCAGDAFLVNSKHTSKCLVYLGKMLHFPIYKIDCFVLGKCSDSILRLCSLSYLCSCMEGWRGVSVPQLFLQPPEKLSQRADNPIQLKVRTIDFKQSKHTGLSFQLWSGNHVQPVSDKCIFLEQDTYNTEEPIGHLLYTRQTEEDLFLHIRNKCVCVDMYVCVYI